MSQKTIEKIRLIRDIVLSVLILLAGVCFILSCVAIYHRGDRPFSRESVAEQFGMIAIPVYICIGAVIVGGILSWIFPKEERLRAKNDQRAQLRRLHQKIDLDVADRKVVIAVAMERRWRFLLELFCSVLCFGCVIPVALYVFDLSNFTVENLNGDVFGAIWLALGMFSIGFALCLVKRILQDRSIRSELALLKGCPRRAEMTETEEEDPFMVLRSLIKVIVVLLSVSLAVLFLSVLALLLDSYTVPFWRAVALASCVGVPLVFYTSSFYLLFLREKWGAFLAKKHPADGEKRIVWLVRSLILLLAVVMIVAGILNGGMGDVLSKAIRICTECIGLG